jgi:NhaA family Na+:H+ antiporter
VPIATDIAFALAVLAVVSTHLPTALRIFLLTLAVVDDLLAIAVIAFFFTDHVAVGPLAAALIPIGLYAFAVQRGVRQWWILMPPAIVAWALVHASGVHATVAGVVLGFTVPVLGRHASAKHFEHLVRPLSAGFAVPVFAFFAAGVSLVDGDGLAAATDTVTLGIIAGLLVGKPLGVLAGTWLVQRFTRARLAEGLSWSDVLGLALLSGIGFTVSLLIGELAFGAGTPADDHVKIGVLAGSLLAALLAAIVLRIRNAHYRRLCAEEERDEDHGGTAVGHRPPSERWSDGGSLAAGRGQR